MIDIGNLSLLAIEKRNPSNADVTELVRAVVILRDRLAKGEANEPVFEPSDEDDIFA